MWDGNSSRWRRRTFATDTQDNKLTEKKALMGHWRFRVHHLCEEEFQLLIEELKVYHDWFWGSSYLSSSTDRQNIVFEIVVLIICDPKGCLVLRDTDNEPVTLCHCCRWWYWGRHKSSFAQPPWSDDVFFPSVKVPKNQPLCKRCWFFVLRYSHFVWKCSCPNQPFKIFHANYLHNSTHSVWKGIKAPTKVTGTGN